MTTYMEELFGHIHLYFVKITILFNKIKGIVKPTKIKIIKFYFILYAYFV